MQSAWKKLKKWFERQIPHPRETMIFIIIILFLIGKLLMLYIDQMPVEDDMLYYEDDLYGEYGEETYDLDVDSFLYEQQNGR